MAEARRALAEVEMDRREGEDLGAFLDRIRVYFSQGQTFEDSTELIRQSRIERTNELLRAGGHDDWVDDAEVQNGGTMRATRAPIAREMPGIRQQSGDRITALLDRRKVRNHADVKAELANAGLDRQEDEDVVSYFLRLRRWAFGDTVLDTDSVQLLRESRDQRDEQLARVSGWSDEEQPDDA